MKTVRSVIGAAAISLLAACLASRPTDNVPFANIQSVKSLEGTYKNVGDTGESGPRNIRLSALIWPAKDVPHEQISEVEIVAIDQASVRVSGLAEGRVLKQSTFVQGKDFHIHNGRITLRRRASMAGFKSGEPMLGPYYETAELGLDQRGNGRYESNFATAGLVFMFLPMALGAKEEVRFARIRQR